MAAELTSGPLVAIPSEKVELFLLESLLRQVLHPEHRQLGEDVGLALHASMKKAVDLFTNHGARGYSSHGLVSLSVDFLVAV